MPHDAFPAQIVLHDEEEARRFGDSLGHCLQPGMTVLLEGPVGAGKSHIARAAIRARLGQGTEVPSPTFTLVQTYGQDQDEIWHADLYRLTHASEVDELGLFEAMETAIVLIEWPDRLGRDRPADALTLRLEPNGDQRLLHLSGGGAALRACLAQRVRHHQKQHFLAAAGWANATRSHLAGDASARSYERLTLGGQPAVLMDAPPGCGDEVEDFVKIGAHLAGLGLSPPKILARDLQQGFLLLEDLGDDVFTNMVARDPATETPLYLAATQVLLTLQDAPPPPDLPCLTQTEWAASALLAPEFYTRAATGHAPDASGFLAELTRALAQNAAAPTVLILRDYHAGNLLWLPERQGVARVGLLDFQLGQLGQPEYDLVSLLQDARRDVSPETEAAALALFARASGKSVAQVEPAYATLGALRALRILGIFARLCLVAGKDQYLQHLPRVWGQLMRNLAHPALAALRHEVLAILPPPTPDVIQRIKDQCGSESSP